MQTLGEQGVLVEATGLVFPDKKNVIRVLHVDDDPSLLEITKLMLLDLDSGFEIDNAASVDEGLYKLAAGNYDIVVSDYEMPKKDGLQFLMELRKQNNRIPFILFTGKGREEVAIKALNLGADGYHNKQGSPETVYGELSYSIKQVVERNKIKEALQEQETRFIKLAAQTPGMLFQFLRRPDGTYCVPFTSDGISDIFGCKPKDVREDFSPIAKAIIPEDLEKVIHSIEQSASYLSLWQCEYRVQLPGQKIRWMWGQSAPEKLEDGSILWNGFNTDITESKNAEEKLRGTLEVLERVGEGIDAGLAVIGKDYRVVWANKRLMVLGVAPNKKCYQTFNNSETICPDCGVKKIFEQNSTLDVHEFKTLDSKGETVWIELRVTPFKDKNGNVTAALELAIPITERKKAEQKIKQEAVLRNTLLDNLPCTALILEKKTRKIVASNKIAQEYGAITGEICYETCAKRTDPCTFCLAPKLWATNETQSLEVEYEGKFYRGIWMPYNEDLYVHYIFDITEYKKTEAALLLSEEKFRKAFAMAPNAVYISTLKEGRLIEVNDRFEEMFGYTKQEIIGQTSLKLGLWANPSDRERMLDRLRSGEKIKNFNINCVRKNQQIFPAQFSVSVMQKDDKQVLIGIIRDVTSFRVAEEALKTSFQETEILNEKLRVVGGLTRHDVGNKLAVIGANEFLLRKHIGNKPELTKYLDSIKNAVAASNELFEFSQVFEKIGSEKPVKVNVFQCFNNAVALFSDLNDVNIVNECQGLEVLADSLLMQLFYNLIDNSLKHGEKVNKILLHSKFDGDMIKLVYEDNGVGVSGDNKLRIFDVGFTTGNGSGLGLPLIKRIVEVYGWAINEIGERGKGAKFVISIPVHLCNNFECTPMLP